MVGRPSSIGRTASARLQAALRLATEDDHKLRVFASLHAQLFIGDDQRGSWRQHSSDPIQDVLRNHNAIERELRAVRYRHFRLDGLSLASPTPALWLYDGGVRTSIVQRDGTPSHTRATAGLL